MAISALVQLPSQIIPLGASMPEVSVSDKPSSSLPGGRGHFKAPLKNLIHGSYGVVAPSILPLPESSQSLATLALPTPVAVSVGKQFMISI